MIPKETLKRPTNQVDHPLGNSWNLSESYLLTAQRNSANYVNNNHSIFEFESLSQFSLLWKHTPYSTPSNIFYDDVANNTRKFRTSKTDPEEKALDGLLLFKKGVKPEWEDPANQNGCSFDCNLKNLTPEQIDEIWQNMVLGLVGETFPFVQFLTGIRFMDRLKKHSSIKIEIWISVGLGSTKIDSDDYVRNGKIVDRIVAHFLVILNHTTPVSEFELTKNEHHIRLKVN